MQMSDEQIDCEHNMIPNLLVQELQIAGNITPMFIRRMKCTKCEYWDIPMKMQRINRRTRTTLYNYFVKVGVKT